LNSNNNEKKDKIRDEENEDKPSDEESLEEEQMSWFEIPVNGHLTPFIYTRKGENSEPYCLRQQREK